VTEEVPTDHWKRNAALMLGGLIGCSVLCFGLLFLLGLVAGVMHKEMERRSTISAPPRSG